MDGALSKNLSVLRLSPPVGQGPDRWAQKGSCPFLLNDAGDARGGRGFGEDDAWELHRWSGWGGFPV